VSKIKFSPVLLIGILIALSFAIALFLRVYLPYDKVFSVEGIKFTSADAYYHMRLVDNLVHNFPRHTSIDPYFIYPGATTGEISIRFFVWLLAIPAWIIGLGSPTQHTIDVVGVYLPAVLGALTVIPVYFIGKELFGRWAGVLSAGLLAILPGEFLGRSKLGFTDYHIAETLFTTVTMLFLILAIKAASQRQLTFGHLKRRDWTTIRKPLIYSLLAAIFLGIYIFTWAGALLFVFITFVYFVIQFIINHLKRKSTDYLCFVGVIFFSVSLLISLLISVGLLYLASLIIALLTPLVLSGVSWLMTNKKIKPAYYPLALFGLGLAGLGLFYLVSPYLVSSMLSRFTAFIPRGAHITTIEMQPLISRLYGNPFVIAWGYFPGLIPYDPNTLTFNFNSTLSFISSSFFLSLISLGILIYLIVKQGSAEKSLLVIWSLAILASNLLQRRFGYYFAVNVALLTGYLTWKILEKVSLRYLATRAVETTQRAGSRRTRPKKGGFPITVNHFIMAVGSLIIFLIVFAVFAPNVLLSAPGSDEAPAVTIASKAPYAPRDAWVSSLTWMKKNTPEPFDNPDAYYELHKPPPPGESYQYPESAYGVLAWWDYGYWITRIAHRIPNANGSQDPQAIIHVASFFTSPDEKSANEIRQELNSAYIVIDHETALGKFYAIVTWAGKDSAEYFDVYLIPQGNVWRGEFRYHPEYYRSLAARLYNFDGKAVTPETTTVILSEKRSDEQGNIYNVVTEQKDFATYEEAEAYLLSQESGNHKIVGTNPMKSPIPLEALEHYQLIHSSDSMVTLSDVGEVPGVKIFEYID